MPTHGQVLRESGPKRRAIRPFPVVRMRGRLTTSGARVSLLSVRAPRAAKVTVRCKGRCPTSELGAVQARQDALTRARAFERSLRSGTRITVTVTRQRLHRQADHVRDPEGSRALAHRQMPQHPGPRDTLSGGSLT